MRQIKSKQSKLGGGVFLYIVVTAWVFVISLTVLNLTGFVPYYVDGTPSNTVVEAAAKRDAEQRQQVELEGQLAAEQKALLARPVLPTRLIIPSTGTSLPISNPNTTDIDELDKELLTSVVRYPGSGSLGRDGNMLIFGHSSGLRTVNNQMFKAFNTLKTLEQGNVIKLIRGDTEYVYTVSNLEHRDAAEVVIDFNTEPGVQQLTLSTCDSFGAKSDRWIITADFVGSFKTDLAE